jgi:hypothetical protein
MQIPSEQITPGMLLPCQNGDKPTILLLLYTVDKYPRQRSATSSYEFIDNIEDAIAACDEMNKFLQEMDGLEEALVVIGTPNPDMMNEWVKHEFTKYCRDKWNATDMAKVSSVVKRA